jgi:predicted O-methyltransferase YrrM
LTEAQGRALFDTAATVPPGCWIVEIGSHCGRSTVLLAAAKQEGVRLLAVDPFDDPRWGGGPEVLVNFEATLGRAGPRDQVETFRGVSADAARAWNGDPIGMLFVDGAHDRRSVLTDIDGWTPYLAPTASALFHDAFSAPGVTVALLQRYIGRPGYEYVGSIRSLVQLRKTSQGSVAKSSAGLLLRLPWFARNIAVKIAIKRDWQWAQHALGHRGRGYPY